MSPDTSWDEPARTIFFNGPPGSGKTTTAMLWAIRRARPTFFLDWDSVRSALVIGDRLAGRAEPGIDAQYLLAARVMAAEAEQITGAGVDCALAGARQPAPPPEWAHTWDDLDRLQPCIVVLLPTEEVGLARNHADAARRGAFAVPEERVAASYRLPWREWANHPRAVVIDNSELTLDQTVAVVEDAIRGVRGTD